MEAVAVVAIALAALLVGVLIPLLVQARSVLKSAQKLLDDAGPKLSQTLDETRQAARHLNTLAASVEPAGPRVAEAAEALSGVTAALGRLRGGLHLASAVAPAIAAAIKAFQAVRAANEEAPPDEADDEAETDHARADVPSRSKL